MRLETRKEDSIFNWAMAGDVGQLSVKLLSDTEYNLEHRNRKGDSPLLIAIANDQFEFVQTLLNAGAFVNSSDGLGNTALMRAAFKGNLKLVKLLLKYGADETLKNDVGMTAIDWAIAFNRVPIIAYLSKRGEAKRRRIVNLLRLIKLLLISFRKKRRSLE